ncbi:hypothetical protein ACFYTG_45865 [Streptomyces mirabilis]|uniref:hypothetical protein n=1 Tax=Streptomyces mirabilis TaxID=68239 RepID=UPI00369D6294
MRVDMKEVGQGRALPPREKDALLLDAALGTAPQPGPTLLARHRAASRGTAGPSTGRGEHQRPIRQPARYRILLTTGCNSWSSNCGG